MPHSVRLEISGPTAMWTRPDTGDAPVSYPAPTLAAVKGIFESIVWLKSAEVGPLASKSAPRWSSTRTRPTTAGVEEGQDHEEGD